MSQQWSRAQRSHRPHSPSSGVETMPLSSKSSGKQAAGTLLTCGKKVSRGRLPCFSGLSQAPPALPLLGPQTAGARLR